MRIKSQKKGQTPGNASLEKGKGKKVFLYYEKKRGETAKKGAAGHLHVKGEGEHFRFWNCWWKRIKKQSVGKRKGKDQYRIKEKE